MYENIMEKGNVKNVQQVKDILNNIQFAPSCVDMHWEWCVEEIPDYGYLISVSFERPDTHTGEIGRGWGREWFLRAHCTEKFVVMTAKVAIDFILKHESMEAFHYKGARIIDPHKSLEELAYPQKLGEENSPKLREINKKS
jgi:hypothetical protein